jgi:antitoxin component HigA of HigAB toxin-antitoxin module
MRVRFFGGWDFGEQDAESRLPAVAGYARGVPMGGDLRGAPGGRSPTFLVYAMKDPISGNLDRIQIIKGWMDSRGRTHEKVYDVAWSGDRQPGSDGKLPPVGNTVDVANATWTNTIGSSELITVWTDPDFDPEESAFYYARVIEIPTPRWTAYEAKRYGIDMPDEVPMVTQERAYTSPIWYTPPGD